MCTHAPGRYMCVRVSICFSSSLCFRYLFLVIAVGVLWPDSPYMRTRLSLKCPIPRNGLKSEYHLQNSRWKHEAISQYECFRSTAGMGEGPSQTHLCLGGSRFFCGSPCMSPVGLTVWNRLPPPTSSHFLKRHPVLPGHSNLRNSGSPPAVMVSASLVSDFCSSSHLRYFLNYFY